MKRVIKIENYVSFEETDDNGDPVGLSFKMSSVIKYDINTLGGIEATHAVKKPILDEKGVKKDIALISMHISAEDCGKWFDVTVEEYNRIYAIVFADLNLRTQIQS